MDLNVFFFLRDPVLTFFLRVIVSMYFMTHIVPTVKNIFLLETFFFIPFFRPSVVVNTHHPVPTFL